MTNVAERSQIVWRPTGRVLPVAPDGSVLLLRELDPADPSRPYWSSVGGAVEAGEQAINAALRELTEETGIEADRAAMLGPVHITEQSFTWNRQRRHGYHTYFAVSVPRGVEVSWEGLQPEELDTVLGAEWWTPQMLADQPHREPGLPQIMRTAIDAVAALR